MFVKIEAGNLHYVENEQKGYEEVIFESGTLVSPLWFVSYMKESADKVKLYENLQHYYLYLSSTDWYYARKAETGEEVPEDIVAKRIEAREFIRANEDA